MINSRLTIFILVFFVLFISDIYAQTEIIGERTMNSKVFQRTDGKKEALISSVPIHFFENGQWDPITLEIVPSSNAATPYQNSNNVLKTQFPDFITSNNFVSLILDSGEKIDIEALKTIVIYQNGILTSMSLPPVSPIAGTVNQSRIDYVSIYPSISDGYEILAGKLKNEITLDAIPADLNGIGSGYYGFREAIHLPVGWNVVSASGISSGVVNEDLFIKNAIGQTKLVIPAPIFFDNSGQSSDCSSSVFGTYFFEQNSGVVQLSTLVPVSWLKEANRQYPVILDPTIVTLAGMNGGWMSGNNLINNPNFVFVGVCCGNLLHRGWIRFNVSSIPDGSCILDTELGLNCNAVGGAAGERVFVNDVTGPHGPYGGINATVYADLADGTYTDFIATGAGVYPFLSLGPFANVDVKASLPTDFYQVAMHFENEPSTNWKRFIGTSSNLRVTYDTPVSCVLLNTELSEFETACYHNSTIINWATDSEKNLDYFAIEKSEDGQNFVDFQLVNSNNNSTSIINYNAVDANPYSGITYYRLRLQQIDGTFNYSEIRANNCGKKLGNVTISPIPSTDVVKVEFVQNNSSDVNLILMNNFGEVLKRIAVSAKRGINQQEIDISELSAGTYILIIKDGGQQAVRKVVKK